MVNDLFSIPSEESSFVDSPVGGHTVLLMLRQQATKLIPVSLS